MKDRQPMNPGRVKITLDDGTVLNGILERNDSPQEEGTPINKNTLFNSNNSERYASELPSEAFELLTKEWQVDVQADGWSSSVDSEGYYTQTITASGMKSVYKPNFMPLYGSASDVDTVDEAFSVIKRMTTSDGSITFLATEKPAIDITIRIWRV